MFARIVVVVMDSVGIGALPDAAEYGDFGSDTLGNIARSQGGLFLPTLTKMGLGSIAPIQGVPPAGQSAAWFGKMAEISVGKDTVTGHWEMTGCPLFHALPLYPGGFPADLTDKLMAVIGRPILGNKAASGTAIIEELGAEHVKTGDPIVYTSADSVLQIAAHEEVIPLPQLYDIGRRVREEVCIAPHAVGRVIVRPFLGKPGSFFRTPNRHDYALPPPGTTVLDLLKDSGRAVTGIGKIGDIFAGRGITTSNPTKSNDHGMQTLLRTVGENSEAGLIFANLVEFDSVYGHRNDVTGYARALERLDGQLALLLPLLGKTDLLMITADHGCDPTQPGTDHTREYVPLIVYSGGRPGNSLGVRSTFADIGATVAANFALPPLGHGRSFLNEITR
ncbi:MAG: phosphopentomutase [Negativicutes bacterium]|nr:phosphopentomutase [Negativicutes bacterium]